MNIITPQIVYKAAVIGAGPAGLACVGNLLDLLPETGNKSILWIDPEFGAGRLASYPLVPSNTKVNLFTKFALECKSFDATRSSPTFRRLNDEFDGMKGCELRWAAEMCKELTACVLKREDQIEAVCGRARVLEHSKTEGLWRISTTTGFDFRSELVFLATGSAPKSLPNIPGTVIHLDDALNPERLSTLISSHDVVGVYGSSHSAMLVLKNLLEGGRPKLVVNYYRQDAKFAEYPDPIACPDKILHDNTGLKGQVADWVRTWINLSAEELSKRFEGSLVRIKGSSEHIACNKNIFAVGYARNPLPSIIFDSKPLNTESIDYDPIGNLAKKGEKEEKIIGLYGFGIAFPERVKDLTGEEELAVGLWKFMKHVKKSIKMILSNQ